MFTSRLAKVGAWWLVSVACAACDVPDLPGEEVGTYQITGALLENECGEAAVPALARVTFPAELRNDRGQALWRRPDAPLATGRISRDGHYLFELEVRHPVTAETSLGPVECTLRQRDRLDVSLRDPADGADGGVESDAGPASDGVDAGNDEGDAGPASDGVDAGNDEGQDAARSDAGAAERGSRARRLVGTHDVEMAADDALACEPLKVASGGPFLALPCRVRYSLTGEPRERF
jgi:hypothetical protein